MKPLPGNHRMGHAARRKPHRVLGEPAPQVAKRFGEWWGFWVNNGGGFFLAEGGELPGGRLRVVAIGGAVRCAGFSLEFECGPLD